MNVKPVSTRVTRIAHLSDVHMLDTGKAQGFGLGVRFLSIGRELNAKDRVRKFSRGLKAAKRSGADHFVISGDLTEIGSPAEFQTFADVLLDSGIHPEKLTLVPGNHDAYSSPTAWAEALDGPLRPFRAGSASAPGKVVEREGVVFMPVDVACHQPITRSAGELSEATFEALSNRLADPALRNRAIVLVQHHPPFCHSTRAWQWIDGLRGWARLMELLVRHPNVQVLHGHLHHVVDKIVGLGKSRIFGAPATVDDTIDAARVRLYDVRDGVLESQGILEG